MKLHSLIRRITFRGAAKILRSLPNIAANTWYHWIDASLDRKYGIDTQGIIDDMRELDAPLAPSQHANGYEGIQIPVFKRILKELNLAPQEYIFIDFGSGKGRACIMAAERNFAKVLGVEFSPVLHTIARRNADRFKQHRPRSSAIELHLQDAATFVIPDGKIVCFFYNPFDATVLRKVIANIEAAFRIYKKSTLIVYRNAVHAEIFDTLSSLSFIRATTDYRLYQLVALPHEGK